MFDVIAHKEGAKLIQNCFCLMLMRTVYGRRVVKRKKPGLFQGYREWIFIGGTKNDDRNGQTTELFIGYRICKD
jgi:hypothetical protein